MTAAKDNERKSVMEGEATFHYFYVGLSFFVLPGPKRGALPVRYLIGFGFYIIL